MSEQVPARLRWAAQVIAAQPEQQLLEVGCGPGVSAALVCPVLTTGRLVAVDRSAVALERAARRNAEHVATGRLVLRHAALADLSLPAGAFDAAFAVDVNVFWASSAEAELAVLRSALRQGGAVHLLWGSGGPTSAERMIGPVATALRAHGFVDLEVLEAPDGVGVSARTPG